MFCLVQSWSPTPSVSYQQILMSSEVFLTNYSLCPGIMWAISHCDNSAKEVNSDKTAAHYTCTRFTQHASETLRCFHPVSLQLLKEDKCVSLWEQEIWVQETGQAGVVNKHTHRVECVNYTASLFLTAYTLGAECLCPWPVSTCREKCIMGWVRDNAQLPSAISFPKGFHLISRHSIGQFTQNVFLLLKTRDAVQRNGPRTQVFFNAASCMRRERNG